MIIITILLLLFSATYQKSSRVLSIALVINQFYLLNQPDDLSLVDFFGINFATGNMENIFALMVSILYCANNFYSIYYMAAQKASNLEPDLQPKIHFLFMPLAILASIFTAYASNLITMFIAYELLTLTTYPLVIQSGSTEAKTAGRFYLITLLGTSSLFFLFAIIFINYNYGNTSLTLDGIIPPQAEIKEVIILLICFVFGISKTAIFPFYAWLPKAMVAPIPVSALLHAVAVVKTGIFALIKIFVYVFGIDYLSNIDTNFLSLLACFTIVFAGIMAAKQDTLKKLLAYSTVSQLSYMILALSFVSNKAVIAAFMQMMSHSIAKISLFFLAGIIYLTTGKSKISQMKGMFSKQKYIAIIFILASFSICALPLSIGYITMHQIYALVPNNYLIITCLALSSLLSCYYYLRVICYMLLPAEDNSYASTVHTQRLLWITAISFALSLLFMYYFTEITNYLGEDLWIN